MGRLGKQAIRRAELVEATIAEIGAAGNLDVTVGQIARRAGVSSALAHHYFGGKDQILWAAMHHILREFGQEARALLAQAKDPRARIEAIVAASFSPACFDPATVNSWMILYAHAPLNAGTLRLLVLYQKRLQSNLTHALRPLSARPVDDADALAALIDGLYLRAALARVMDAEAAKAQVMRLVDRLVVD
jgi:TetR/AcrR family transcriptional repressor of bet genes